MKWNSKAGTVSTFLFAIMILLSACGGSSEEYSLTFDQVPQRAVALNQHTAEIMLALGLEQYMAGTAYLDDEILPEYKEQYDKIPVLSDKYPSQEVFLSVNPDFAYAGWKSAFREDGVGTVERLEELGIKAYLQQSSNMTGPTIEDIYTDIRNIARIFQVEERADKLIESINTELEGIRSQVGSVEQPLRVFVYDSGEDSPLTASRSFLTNLIEMAGGKNVFDDTEKNWTKVTLEEVVKRNPEVIVIVNYGDTTVEQKKQLLLSHPALAEVAAIRNQRFVVLPLSAGAEGVRASIALGILAKGFYPDKFN